MTSLYKNVINCHNTPLPSNAFIERGFSIINAILTKRGMMDKNTFEKTIVFKYN